MIDQGKKMFDRLNPNIAHTPKVVGPVQEPVAWGFRHHDGAIYDCISPEAHADCEGEYNVPLYDAPPKRTVQVSPLEFVEMVMDKEHLVGNPIVWAQWPNKEKNT